ncbi:UPF0058 family protein [Salarchaeum sp. III]|uniref:UPF0058 family protein n=1 Tax=Salarchaeum sp. III TaxID=3107927 RepID=UPI002ED7B365
MKKQELIHLHGLLAEVSNFYEGVEDDGVSLDKYQDLGVRPTSIHKSKTEHKAAVFALASGITTSVESEAETVAAQAD